MSRLGLVLHNIRHAWLRNMLLILSIVIAYTLFGTLMAFERAYSSSDKTGLNRMLTFNKITFTQPLPISHFRMVQNVEGVDAASFATWFGGYYREPRNALHTLAVDPRSFLAIYEDELKLGEQERSTFIRERASMLVGQTIAKRFGWSVGDQVPIFNRKLLRADGTQAWTFHIAGIFKGTSPRTDTTFLYIHYDLVNEARMRDQDTISWIITMPVPGLDPSALGQAIDRRFETSAVRTTTDSERSLARTFVAQFGDLAQVTILVLGAALFSLLVIVASTTALAVRHRAREIGVLKGLGFPHLQILGLLIGESTLVVLAAGIAGLTIAAFLVGSAAASFAQIAPGMTVSPEIIAMGLISLLVLAILASALPAWRIVSETAASILRRG